MRIISVFLIFISVFSFFLPAGRHGNFADAAVSDEIAERQKQIQELERQIQEYQTQILEKRGEAKTLQNEISKFNYEIGKIQLEIKSLDLNIQQTSSEIKQTENKIVDAEQKILKLKEGIASFIRLVNSNDQESLVEILIKNENLSDFFNNVENIKSSQDKAKVAIINLRSFKKDLEDRERELEEQKDEQVQLRRLQEFEKRNLDFKKAEKDSILKETKGQEKKFQELVKRSQQDIQKIREQITFLLEQGITVEDAIKFGQLAAIRAGIRPEFLLAILEIESRLGKNVGSGNWRDDMYECYLRLSNIAKTAQRKQFYIKRAETEKNAFFAIIGKLGLNPDSVKVSREPTYGCGGAMGPAQFIPSTWLAYEDEVTRLTGRPTANPWNIEDAFMASAIKLARGGATSKDARGETRAAKAYIGGSPTCSQRICNTYVSLVLRKAEELAKSLYQ